MIRNMGNLDRALRITAALLLAYLAWSGAIAGVLAVAAWVVAAIFLVTSVVSFCPLYRLVGVNTCPNR